jgi:hypothetical protein
MMNGNRISYRPEPIPAAIPPSMRGYFEAAPEPARPGMFRVWLHGDCSQTRPRSILLTRSDIRRFCSALCQLAESQEVGQ